MHIIRNIENIFRKKKKGKDRSREGRKKGSTKK